MSTADHDGEASISPDQDVAARGRRQRVHRTGGALILAGVALFLVATVVVPVAANPGRKNAAPTPTQTKTAGTDLTAALPYYGSVQPAGDKLAVSKPKHVKQKAPATKAVVSALAANGIPNIALNAYRVAAARLANAEPGCGIDWALLAGIGREESDHGRFAGARLNADGTSTPRIIGIPLNGVGTARIGDSDGGSIDGDPHYDRAAGPMQFIPTTWAGYGTDADSDGKADIFNINDAALSAARYLCATGGDLRTHAGQVAAVLAYNHSDEYLAQVLALAQAYRTGVPVHGVPVGNVDGGLPPVHDTGYAPPVNPGPPTAVSQRTAKQKTAAQQAARRAAAAKAAHEAAVASKHPASSPPPPARPAPSSTPPPSGGGGNGGGTGGGGSGGSGGGSGGGGTSTTHPAPPPTSAPIPTPTKTCLLWDLFDHTRCLLWL
jgi:membrane-bound lytic murein transglycosylase B